MFIDDDMRIVIIEGLAAPGCGMQSIYMDIPRTKGNDHSLKILSNPEVLFPSRLYGEFGPDLKRIRIRDKLKKLARRPELYNRKQVDEICFAAIDNVMSLRWAPDLRSTKELNLYPSAESLKTVELLYGDAISTSDLDGTKAEEQRAFLKKQKKLAKAQKEEEEKEYQKHLLSLLNSNKEVIHKSPSATHTMTTALSSTQVSMTFHPNTSTTDNTHKDTFTDCRNPVFEQYLATRPIHRVDFLSEQQELKKQAWVNMLDRAAIREQLNQETLVKILGPEKAAQGAKIYCYSQQSENFKVKAFAELRQRIQKFTDATYTFSKDFVSQTICVVDTEADKMKIEAEKRSHWLTQRGFQYPKPKTLKDLIEHPKRPSDARIEDLTDAWISPSDAAFRFANSGQGPDYQDKIKLERGYSVRVRGGDLFGSLNPVTFQRPFQLKLVGDRHTLPRGLLTGGAADDKDPASFRSVHLGGTGQALIIQQAEEKEKSDWQSKVVVDDISFKVGGFVTRDKAPQYERTKDILKGEPKRKELAHLRTRKSVTGKDFSYAPAPLSLLSSGQYKPNQAANALLRGSDKTKFITNQDCIEGQVPQDFIRFIDSDSNAPRIMTVLSKKKHPALSSYEQKGPRWEGPNA